MVRDEPNVSRRKIEQLDAITPAVGVVSISSHCAEASTALGSS